ncbi:hypothetical protein LJC55_04300, partial [Eubacteriales bacterium OttesenSCG-928-N14]|nr:hypothetical protein [Eubacteriales bacterium OttesenSCG-928-N14]
MKKRMLCMLLFCLCLLCACGTTQQTPQPSAEAQAQPYTPYWQYSQRYSTSGDGMVFLSTGDGVIQYKHLNAVAQPLTTEEKHFPGDLIATDTTVYAISIEAQGKDDEHIQSIRYGVQCIERTTGQSKTVYLPEDAALSGLDNAQIYQLLYRDGVLLALVSATTDGDDNTT